MDTTHELLSGVKSNFLGLLVDVKVPQVDPYTFSGSLVEIGGSWFWLTAAHCVQNILSTMERAGEENLSLRFWTMADGEGAKYVFLPPKEFRPFDLQTALRGSLSRGESILTERQVEFVDLAVVPVPDATKCYLQSLKVKPFTKPNWQLKTKLEEENIEELGPVVVLGTPQDRTTARDKQIEFELLYFSAFFDPEIEDAVEPPTTWIRLHEFSGCTVGVSGGPVVTVVDDQLFLVGVQTHQRRSLLEGNRVVGIIEPDVFLDVLDRALAGEPPTSEG